MRCQHTPNVRSQVATPGSFTVFLPQHPTDVTRFLACTGLKNGEKKLRGLIVRMPEWEQELSREVRALKYVSQHARTSAAHCPTLVLSKAYHVTRHLPMKICLYCKANSYGFFPLCLTRGPPTCHENATRPSKCHLTGIRDGDRR